MAVTEKVAVWPAVTIRFAGWVVMVGGPLAAGWGLPPHPEKGKGNERRKTMMIRRRSGIAPPQRIDEVMMTGVEGFGEISEGYLRELAEAVDGPTVQVVVIGDS